LTKVNFDGAAAGAAPRMRNALDRTERRFIMAGPSSLEKQIQSRSVLKDNQNMGIRQKMLGLKGM
jgi:hypothetical protein